MSFESPSAEIQLSKNIRAPHGQKASHSMPARTGLLLVLLAVTSLLSSTSHAVLPALNLKVSACSS